MIEYEPNVTKKDLLEHFKLYMNENNVSYTEENLKKLLDQSLTEYIEHINNEEQANEIRGHSNVFVKLPPAYKGKTFYSPSSTLGVIHGHNGLYGTESSIVQANPGRGVTWDLARNTKVASGSRILSVKASTSVVDKAVSRGRAFIGEGYNYAFFANKTTAIGRANCSQLVWAAYKHAGLDLDGDGGPGVYPADIAISSNTFVYQWVF